MFTNARKVLKTSTMPQTQRASKIKKRSSSEKPVKAKKSRLDEDIESESDSEIDSDEAVGQESSEEEEEETPEEKKLRLAKEILVEMNDKEQGEEEEEEDSVGRQLQRDALEQSGKLFKCVAAQYARPQDETIFRLKGHRNTVTCCAFSGDGKAMFSGSKDGSVIKWCLETGKRLARDPPRRRKKIVPHPPCVYCLAVSTDGKFLVTGGRDSKIFVRDPDTLKIVHTFMRAHRKEVTGLAFHKNSHTLFSVSTDRLVKSWSLDEMAFVEAHPGTDMTAVDSLLQECAITVGGRDREVQIHNFPKEMTRKFKAETESDCVALINESYFVTGGNDNSLSLWNVNKAKPRCVVRNAHDRGENWIQSVASLQFTDLIASGSRDNCIRLWQISPEFNQLKPLFTVPVDGTVNCLKFSTKGDYLLAALGSEPRLGRWWSDKAKNQLWLIPLPKS